jgi:hypothetical protein
MLLKVGAVYFANNCPASNMASQISERRLAYLLDNDSFQKFCSFRNNAGTAKTVILIHVEPQNCVTDSGVFQNTLH